MEIELSESDMIIRNQLDFAEFVSGSCQPTIDFSTGTLGTYDYHLVPEPATMSLLGLGGLCALIRRRRRA